LHVIVSVYVDV